MNAAALVDGEVFQQNHRKELSLDDLSADTYRFDAIGFTSESAGDGVENAVVARQVRFALNRLSHDLRVAVVLRHYHGFTYEEIAAIVGCPVGTVKSRVHQAVEQLRVLLGVEEGGEK